MGSIVARKKPSSHGQEVEPSEESSVWAGHGWHRLSEASDLKNPGLQAGGGNRERDVETVKGISPDEFFLFCKRSFYKCKPRAREKKWALNKQNFSPSETGMWRLYKSPNHKHGFRKGGGPGTAGHIRLGWNRIKEEESQK